jgi:hypothetical protein
MIQAWLLRLDLAFAAVVPRTVDCCAEEGGEEGEVMCNAMAGIEIREAGGCSRKCEW